MMSYLLLGFAALLLHSPSLPPPPDLDGDGVAEVLEYPSRPARTNALAVKVMRGSSGPPLATIPANNPDTAFGWRAFWIADADGDGAADIAVCEPLATTSQGLGIAHVYSSRTTSRLFTLVVSQRGQFGLDGELIADRDGDGVPDLVIWSLRQLDSGSAVSIPWLFSSRDGTRIWPPDEDSALAAVRSDVDVSGEVAVEDVVTVAGSVGAETPPDSQSLDVNLDSSLDSNDVFTVIANLGTTLPQAPPGLRFVGWNSLDPYAAQLVEADAPPVPPAIYRSGNPGPIVIAPPSAEDIPGDGDGGGGGGGGPPDPNEDDNPADPFDNGPSCSPKIDQNQRYICLRPEEEDGCIEFALTASGGAGSGPPAWSIEGGVFIMNGQPHQTATADSVTVRVCGPGEVAVFVGRPAACIRPRQRLFRVLRVDVDADSDNTTPLAPPDRFLSEELVEAAGAVNDHPGKVIRTGRWDSDGDGLRDASDGFDCVPDEPRDNGSAHRSPAIVIEVQGPMEDNAALLIEYGASDPAQVGTTDDPLGPAPGLLRLWTVDTDEPRDARAVQNGGHFVPPGPIKLQTALDLLGPPPWTLYVEAVYPGLGAVSVQVDPDGVEPPLSPGDSPGGPEPFLCPDAAQTTGTQLIIKALACPTCDEVEIDAFPESVEQNPGEVDQPPEFFDRYLLYRVELHDWREFDQMTLNQSPMPLTRLGSDASTTEWFYFATGPHPAAPPGVARLNPAGPLVFTHYNPDGTVPSTRKLLQLPHVKQLDREVGAAMQRAEALFNANPANATNPDSGTYGKLLHRETSLGMRDKARWQTNIWVHQDTKVVLSANNPDFAPGATPASEVDLAYMKRGKFVTAGQVFVPADVELAFEIKTSYRGEIGQGQLTRYRAMLNDRSPVTVHVPKRQAARGGVWVVESNPVALRKIGTLSKFAGAAGGAFLLFNTAMALAEPATSEDQAWQDVEIAVTRYLSAHGSDIGLSRLALLDLVDAMRRWLTAATGDPNVARVATEMFTRLLVDRLWR